MIEGPVLVIAAHPDDEVLGCGGTMARAAAEGAAVHVLFLADGVSARGGGTADVAAALARRREAAVAAAAALGARPPAFGDFPDNRLDGVPLIEIVQRVEEAIARIHPATVITHHGGDLNIDHRLVHQAVVTACRPLPGSSVRALWCFETVSSTEWASAAIGDAFRPTLYVDIAAFLEAKLRALDCYGEEMRAFPHARSREAVEALARLRGASAGRGAAESFVPVCIVVG